jgi:hypothetical protein
LLPGDADHEITGRGVHLVAAAVVLERAPGAVGPVSVDLEDQLQVRPEEVDQEAVKRPVDEGLRQLRLPAEFPHETFGRRAVVGIARLEHRADDRGAGVVGRQAMKGGEECGIGEPVFRAGLGECVVELGGGGVGGEIDQRSSGRGQSKVLVSGGVVSMQ